tara:strand:- start:166 stop:882 length:717 start_codon:yes stop_codon:yes gene_type:complete
MSINKKEIQKNNYFNYRNITEKSYKSLQVPLWIEQEIKNKDSKILDYGCGFGQNLKKLKHNNYKNIYGADIDPTAIQSCQDNNLTVKQLNLENLINPYDFKFDVIILSHIVEHIKKSEIINTLTFIKNEFLSENGKLLIAVPNAQSNTDCYWAYEDWTHTTLFTSGSIYYVLKAAGFNKIEFLDVDCTLGNSKIKSIVRKFFLMLYVFNKKFWNKITNSAFHQQSPQIFSYEIKVKAQ